MSEVLKDHPDVAVLPPLVPLAILVLAIALQWLAPLHMLVLAASMPRIILGSVIELPGAIVVVNGQRALTGHGHQRESDASSARAGNRWHLPVHA